MLAPSTASIVVKSTWTRETDPWAAFPGMGEVLRIIELNT